MRSVWGGDRPPGLEEDAMCGRYALYGPVSRLREVFEAEPEGFDVRAALERGADAVAAGGAPATERRAGDPPPGVDQAVVSPAAISITAMAAGRSRSNCSGLDEAD
jgi:hypothetical protein